MNLERFIDANAAGQPLLIKLQTGTIEHRITYDSYHYPTEIKIGTAFHRRYGFDAQKANLSWRNDQKTLYGESFTYDTDNRLTSMTSGGYSTTAISYNAQGGIARKGDAGDYIYNAARPHALDRLENNPLSIAEPDQHIACNADGKATLIEEGDRRLEILYGPDGQRVRSRWYRSGLLHHTVWYVGDYERHVYGTDTLHYHYIAGPAGLAAINIRHGGADSLFYVCADYQGNLLALLNPQGQVVEEQDFDAWGRRRNPADHSYAGYTLPRLLTRGYTGHEHLDAFGLINMNGRLYDPVVGMFLSPDPYVQAPGYALNYNRYAYCLNNPLMYTDPSGELFIVDDWVIGFVKGFVRSIGGTHEDGHRTLFGDAWASANRHAGNSAKIWGGLFAADTDRGGWGWQIVSRLIWQAPQTVLGFLGAHGQNMFGQVTDVEYCEGATVITAMGERVFFSQTTAYTLGSYIIGGNDLEANIRNPLFQHEYGHYLQSQASGWAYIPRFAIPSALNPSRNGGFTDLSEDTEQDAQARSLLYFTKYVDGFTYNDWRYDEHPFYDAPNGTEVDPSMLNESFLKGKLMIPTYIQELVINHVELLINHIRNSTRNYYRGY